MSKVIVTMQGGLITSVLSNDMNIEVLVVDYDSEGADEDEMITQEEVDVFVDLNDMHSLEWKSGVSEESMDFRVIE